MSLYQPLSLINGEWVSASSGATFDVINPASGQVVEKVADQERRRPRRDRSLGAGKQQVPKEDNHEDDEDPESLHVPEGSEGGEMATAVLAWEKSGRTC